MANNNRTIVRLFAYCILLCILCLGVLGIYECFNAINKPVANDNSNLYEDTVNNYFEVNGRKYYFRSTGNPEEVGHMISGLDDFPQTQLNDKSPSLREVLSGSDDQQEDYSIFGYGVNDIQKRYIQSVLNSKTRTIEVSRWVTSGDWSQDNEEMTITTP